MSDAPNPPVAAGPPEPGDASNLDEHDQRLGIVLAVVLLSLFATVGFTVQVLNVAFGIWFTEVFLFLGVTAMMLRWSGRDPVRYPDVDGGRLSLFAFGFLVGAVNLFAVGLPLQFLSQQLVPQSWRETFDAANLFKNQAPLELAVIAVGVAIAAPVCEEYFFRGVLLKGLATRRSQWRALGISAFLFSLFHLDPVGLLARTELGLVFGFLYLRTGSLWPGIAAHAANNSVSMAAYFLARNEGSAGEAVTPEAWRSMLLLVAFGVPILYSLFRAAQSWRLLEPRVPPQRVLLAPVKFSRVAFPWIAAAAASLALLFAIDRRGVQLNWIDAQQRLVGVADREQQPLRELRRLARRGQVPIAEYEAARKALARPR